MDAQQTLDVLLELTRRLTEDRSLQDALQLVTDAALGLLNAEHASVRLLDESRTELLAGARSGVGAENRTMTFRPGEGIIGWVVAHGEVARIGDTATDARFEPPPPGQGFQVRSILAVPLHSAGQVVGVLGLTSPAPNAFSAGHELLGRLLANCASPPIERARLLLLSMTDHRTKAFNASVLLPRLREEMERARKVVQPLSVALLDLDRFKEVNDTFGHGTGDRVLEELGARLRGLVRRMDALVRRGGDEFVLIMPATSAEEAHAVALRLVAEIAGQPFVANTGLCLRQTASVGVATWDGCERAEELEARADEAMYHAKRAGGDRVALAEVA